MSLRLFMPHESLREDISAYYLFDATNPSGSIDRLLPEWGNIRLILDGRWRIQFGTGKIEDVPETVLNGFISRAPMIVSDGPSRIAGIGIMPKGWARLIGTKASDHVDRICDLSTIFGEKAAKLLADARHCTSDSDTVATLEAFFQNLVAERAPAPVIIDAIFSVLMNGHINSVEEFSERLGVSTRQCERLCRRYFGFSPKLLLRRQRFLRAFSRIRSKKMGTWVENLDEGYADQSHFIREFRYFVRLSPSDYFGKEESIVRQIADARERFFGEAVQGLYWPKATGR
jgi:AraC-like DNA-binding protein